MQKQLINAELLAETLARARQSERRRTNFNFHAGMQDNPHRFLNVLLRDTYITPHRHLKPPKAESFLILHGTVAFFTFAGDGSVTACDILSGLGDAPLLTANGKPAETKAANPRGPAGIDITPGVWHSLVVLSEYACCFEVKPGPYEPSDDKEFAPWAPNEFESAPEERAEYLARLCEIARAQNPNTAAAI